MRKRFLLGLGLGAAALVQAAAWSACTPIGRTFGGGTGGQTTGTGGHGTGGMEGCKPGDSVACYDGPAATKDVGNCKSGTTICDAEGKPGVCEGQVLPAPTVDCSKHEDQDCDGVPDRCPLDFIWGKAYGVAGGGGFVVPSLDIDATGNIVYGGTLYGQLDFGSGISLASTTGDADGFIAKVDPTGQTIWARKFGDTDEQRCNMVRADAQGNVIMGGSYRGALQDIGIVINPSAGSTDAFVTKLDKDGNAIWARWGGDTNNQSVDAMTLTKTGDVIVAGSYDGTFSFNGGGTTFSNAIQNGSVCFIQRFDKDGNAQWGVSLSNDPQGGYANQSVYDMAVDINGDLLVTGYFEGTIIFPNGSSSISAGSYDIFVMKLRGTDGQVLWTRTYGGPNNDEGFGLVTDSQGSVYLSGRFDTSLTIGGDTVTPQAGQPTGIYLAKLTPAGQPIWLKGFGCGTDAGGMLMGVGENNTLLLVGAFDGSIDFGGGPIDAGVTPGSFTAAGFLAKLDSDGNHIASRGFSPVQAVSDAGPPGPSLVVTYRVDAAPMTNEIVIGGLAFGQFDLGGGVIGLPNASGPFLGKYAP